MPEPAADRPENTAAPQERRAERNIARLLNAADRPPEPSEVALARWRHAMLEELPAVARRERVRRLRAWAAAPLAAACLLAVTLVACFWEGEGARERDPVSAELGFRVTARSGSPQWRAARSPTWTPLGNLSRLSPGDSVGVSPGELELRSEEEERLAFADGRVTVVDEGLRLERGVGEWVAPEGATATLATPLLTITATASRVRLRVETLPLPGGEESRETWEGSEMNGRVIGAGLGVALIVTVIVLSTGDEPVEIDREGEKTTLSEGDSATVTSGGTTSVSRGGDEAIAKKETADRDRASIVEGLESLPEVTEAEFWVQVLDPEGAPVEGASVVVAEGTEPPNPEGPTEGGEVRRGTTDAEGRTSLRIPPEWTEWAAVATAPRLGSQEGSWSKAAETPGAESPGEDLGDSGAAVIDSDPTAIASELVALALGATEENPFILSLPYETSITATVIDAATGEPIVGALTAIQRDVGPSGWSDPKIESSEAEDGSFYFGGLQPGSYWLWSTKEGFSRSDRWSVTVAEGERVSGDPIALVPGVDVKVTVFEKSTGKPVSGAVVYPHLDHLPGTVDYPHRGRYLDERVRDAARTNDEGIAVLRDLPARTTLLRVLHNDFRTLDFDAEGRPGEQMTFEVALEKGPSIRGEVIDAEGRAVDESEIYAVTMTMNREKAEVHAGEIREGRYEIPNVNAGQYIVIFNGLAGDGSDMKMQFSQVVAGKDTVVDFVEVAELATIRGRILDHEDQPLSRRFVTVSTIDELGEVTFRSATTSLEGTFEIKNLALKEWAVAVSHSPESMVTIATMNLDQPIDYEEEFSVPSGSLVGVIRAEDGASDIRVELFIMRVLEEGQLEWRGRSEALPNGRFEFVGLEPGTYRVFAQGLGYRQTSSADVAVGEGESKVDMEISAGGTVKVIVTDGTGNFAPDIGVRILAPEGYGVNEGLPARTNGEGEYVFPSLGPGEYRVTLHRDGVPLEGEKSFTAKMGETVEVRMSIP